MMALTDRKVLLELKRAGDLIGFPLAAILSPEQINMNYTNI